jgi:multicomponent Na+:H+ antiporter subunit B
MNAKLSATLAVVVTGAVLFYGLVDFPDFGDPASPANAGVEGGAPSVSLHYINESYKETKVPNLVTSVLADYRGYDTMFETVVIFAAGLAIFVILRNLRADDPAPEPLPASEDRFIDGDHQRIIVGTTCRIAIPLVQIFALYVVAHGHHSPGGGFQGGVMLGASFILVALAGNLRDALARLGEATFMRLASLGILIYAAFGLVPQLLGRNFLDYGVLEKVFLTDGPEMARSHSMLGVEVGVALTVMSIMFAIFANLSSRGEMRGGL